MKKIICLLLTMAMLIAAMPAMAEQNYYTVSELVFTDFEDNVIENPDASSCMVRTTITKNKARDNIDSIIIMAYSTDNTLISFNVMKGSMSTDSTTQFSALINIPSEKTLGHIKATVWDSIVGMSALSNVSTLECNPTVTPPEDDDGITIPDTYEIKGMIYATNRSHAFISSDKIRFHVSELVRDYSDCETTEEYNEKNTFYDNIVGEHNFTDGAVHTFNIADSVDKSNLLVCMPGTVTLKIEDGAYNMLEFKADETRILNAYKIDEDDYDSNPIWESGSLVSSPRIRVYETEDASYSQSIRLSSDFMIFVNGVNVMTQQVAFDKYVMDNATDGIMFVDTNNNGDYDCIYTNYYATAQIAFVNTSIGKILFNNIIGTIAGNIVLDPYDDDLSYEIYYNGEEIDITDLQENDIITIAYDVTSISITDSYFYEIHVSRDTAEGMYMSKDTYSKTVTIGENKYKYAGYYAELVDTLSMGDEYKIYLDVFGRIAFYEMIVS